MDRCSGERHERRRADDSPVFPSGCAIADQLGHSRVSMTQDVYLGRKAKNAGNLDALEALNPDGPNYKNEEGEETADEEGAA